MCDPKSDISQISFKKMHYQLPKSIEDLIETDSNFKQLRER
jgi:hypothetical protein